MTDTATARAGAAAARPAHPLDPASAAEYLAGREILAAAGLLGESVRFAYYGLEEPAKDEVITVTGWAAGRPSPSQPSGRPDRRLRVFLIDVRTGESADVVVSLTSEQVVSRRVLDPRTDGQLPILTEDFAVAEEIVRADPQWRAAMARRGLTDVTKIRTCPLTAGSFGGDDEDGRRMVRVLAFVQADPHDYAWSHPVDGVAAYLDLIERRVFRVVDEFERPVPAESGDYDDPAVRGPLRTGLRPIEITQPEGPSFTLEGTSLRWQNWSMRIGFDAREGLTLHQISIADGDTERPLIYRASVPEMVVPYGDPAFRYWQAYFDSGEYLVGKWVNSLELGCDCLGEIAYTVGNYDYGFYWYFYLDGTIECEVKMTGTLFTAAYPGGDYPYSAEVAPGLGAPVHQHLFSARLDMTVDGLANAVDEVDVSGSPVGSDNPYGNAIIQTITRLGSESAAARRADTARGRTWRVVSTERVNRFGQPTAYALYPEAAPVLLADPSSSISARSGFATNHLWVTRYDPAQRYPAGDYVNQHPGGAGLPAFIAGDRDIDGTDIVLWHTFGPAHFPRPEEWPVMPVSRCGFMLKPTGFFDRNPTLDVPPPGNHC